MPRCASRRTGSAGRGKVILNSAATVVTVADLWERTVGDAMTHFYRFGADIIGVRRSDQGTRYLFSDHLGSVSAATTASGTLVGMQHYDPWGRVRTGGIGLTARTFTGQRLDATGLLYYHARYYDPTLGRFISPDSIVPEPGNPQSFNRFAYVYNNPLKYTDPSGHCPVCVVVGALALKAIDYGWTAWDIHQSAQVLGDPNASNLDRRLAELNIILALSLEAGEPDDILPVAVPADDVTRRGLIRVAREALAAGDESALRNLPDWMQPIVRGLVTEDRILAQLGRQGQKRLIEGRVGNELVKTIPDFVDDANRIVGEIKDVAELGWEKQIQAQFEWAQRHGYTYQLIIRRSTIRQGNLAGDIRDLRKRGIDIRFIEDILP
jgi:RHS repeat-associated protein